MKLVERICALALIILFFTVGISCDQNVTNSGRMKGQNDKTIADYNNAIELNPRDAEAYYNRGIAYYNKGQYDQTISDYSKAIEINPKYAEAYNNRAVSCYLKGEYDKVWEDVHKAQNLGYQVYPGFLKDLREASGRQK